MQQYVNWQICIFPPRKIGLCSQIHEMYRNRTLAWNPTWPREPVTSGEEFQSWSVSWSWVVHWEAGGCCRWILVLTGSKHPSLWLLGGIRSIRAGFSCPSQPKCKYCSQFCANEKHQCERFKLKGFATEQWLSLTQVTHVAFLLKSKISSWLIFTSHHKYL